jgi:high affinity Mn2+ porin
MPAGDTERFAMLVNRLIMLCFVLSAWAEASWCQEIDSQAADVQAAPPAAARTWSVHFQATSIGQQHGWFPALYQGENSLPSHPEHRVSVTGTIFLSVRLNPHWEFVINPEIAGGRGFGTVTGIAGFTNGEIPRVASATPTLYLARGYVRYTIPIGGEVERVESAPNQAPGMVPVSRFSWITGKFAVTDFFDGNSYSHDPRTQFMNWSLMYNGAWDYPADVRGYTVGTLQELEMRNWAFRAASVMEPTEANGPTLDTRIGRNRGLALEYEHRHSIAGRRGAVRLLAFQNREHAGIYREALHLSPIAPTLDATQRNGVEKYGFGLNVEQALSQDAGVFGRYGWNDGKTETWAFTEIDRSLSGGLSVRGTRWDRPNDTLGLAAVRNYLSGDHRAFLAAGGYGFIIGDGRLNYRPEQIVECYYSVPLKAGWTVTGDFQRIANPAYNRDRGPVSVETIRLHWER